MKVGRLGFFAILICLPAVLVVGTGWFLIAANIPRVIRTQPSRIGREYRAMAEELIAHPERAAYVGERKKGWVQRSRINGIPWGYAAERGKMYVWCLPQGAETCRAAVVDPIRPFPYGPVFYGGGAVVALVLFWLSGLAVAYFVRFMRERDDFLAATAHDLTTPLVGLRMMIGRNDDEARRLNDRMLLIVNNIKDFLKLGGRRREPEIRPVDVVALAREAYRLFAADYEDAVSGPVGFHVAQDVSGSGGLVAADETMALQILWNLFGNDLKYAAPYGKVEVRFSREGRFVRVAFVDEGQGMAPDDMRRAFDRYYRAKTVLKSGKGGFGIGLCTAREFARAMGGDLTVDPNSPRGCVFTLSLVMFDMDAERR